MASERGNEFAIITAHAGNEGTDAARNAAVRAAAVSIRLSKPMAQNTMQIRDKFGEYEKVPFGNGMHYHAPSGKFVHESKFLAMGAFEDQRRKPPTIKMRCHDVFGSMPMRELQIAPDTTWMGMLEILEKEFGTKMLFEYQDRGGIPVRVDDAYKFERFCTAADDSVMPGQTPVMEVFLRNWKYQEPKLHDPSALRQQRVIVEEKIPQSHEWSSGLFACASDPGLCVSATVMPCVVYGDMAKRMGMDYQQACLGMLFAAGGCFLARQHFRAKYQIPGKGNEDLFAGCCCGPCAVSQMARHARKFPRKSNDPENEFEVETTICCEKKHLRGLWAKSCISYPSMAANNREQLLSIDPKEDPSSKLINCVLHAVPLVSIPVACMSRGQIRYENEIKGTCCQDFLYHSFCASCSVMQEYSVYFPEAFEEAEPQDEEEGSSGGEEEED